MEIASVITTGNPTVGLSSAGSDDSRPADDPFLALLAGMIATLQPSAALAIPAAPADSTTMAAKPTEFASRPPVTALPAVLPADAGADDAATDDEISPDAVPRAGQGIVPTPSATAVPITERESEANYSLPQKLPPGPEPQPAAPTDDERKPSRHAGT